MNQRSILLVEDDPDDEALTLRALRRNDVTHQISVVHDGAEALDYLLARGPYAERQRETDPQLILLDLNLPKVSGLEVLKQIRMHDRTRSVPVVVFTSSREDEDIVQSYAFGANSYVRKPVDFAAFADAVRILGVYWLAVNQAAGGSHP